MLGPPGERGTDGAEGRVRLSSEYKKVYTLFCHRARDGGADTKANPNPKSPTQTPNARSHSPRATHASLSFPRARC